MSASQGKPPSSPRRPWTAEEDSLLGTKSDRALARKLGRTVKAVKTRRRLKGVFLVKEWRPEDDKILGTRPDRQVALLLGRLIENEWRFKSGGLGLELSASALSGRAGRRRNSRCLEPCPTRSSDLLTQPNFSIA